MLWDINPCKQSHRRKQTIVYFINRLWSVFDVGIRNFSTGWGVPGMHKPCISSVCYGCCASCTINACFCCAFARYLFAKEVFYAEIWLCQVKKLDKLCRSVAAGGTCGGRGAGVSLGAGLRPSRPRERKNGGIKALGHPVLGADRYSACTQQNTMLACTKNRFSATLGQNAENPCKYGHFQPS